MKVLPIAYQYIHSRFTTEHNISTFKGEIAAIKYKVGVEPFCSNPKPRVNLFTEQDTVKVHRFPGKSRVTEVSSTTTKGKYKYHIFAWQNKTDSSNYLGGNKNSSETRFILLLLT